MLNMLPYLQKNKFKFKYDALNIYNLYLAKHNGNVVEALKELKSEGKIPYLFKDYFFNYTDFLKDAGITESEYSEAECLKWENGCVFSRLTN